MRIYGNRLIKTLPGELTRPTSAKVREALFNIWQGEVMGCSWLDLCAGNGAMGAEALCRDASIVIGVEKYGKACKIINENWQKIGSHQQEFRIIKGDILKVLKNLDRQEFDLIYFDPPYQSGLYQPVLELIVTHQLLNEEGEIAVEHNPKFWQATVIKGLKISREKNYGNTSLTFYRI
ncbi:16S rRNA (guanine(966)-N(2))-methyltransferase RsmD [Crocosphaera sp.]|uniref:16S rRNA (guanine(966)-N(2))-methyltransferase RsmD n=1 Tax=Crocosphaera sp. TaxID=2729996 RepID=UPI00261FBA15|nr:16S rRNA (guanine(966)-N(2))-methyltransferase RsmD [Crocosphaera sp.]MDJ0582651.1 16S rRNA (guanine(966)-N(2))-methyltransferase RsmD [Crocosphaera sp.]